jgi:lsr operon transcriptional repressor
MTEPAAPYIDDAVLRAAWLYYRDDLTQDQIARVLKVSRATVGRLLERARQNGVVRVELDAGLLGAIGLAGELDARYEGVEFLVVPSDGRSHPQDVINDRVAQAAAQLLRSRMSAGDTLAIGWGDTVGKTLSYLTQNGAVEGVVTLTGGVTSYLDPGADGYRDRLTMIPAPFLASTPELAAAIAREGAIARCMKLAMAAPWKVVGVGAVDNTATLAQLGYQRPEDLEELAKCGAVGDIIGQFFDASGQILDVEVHRRRIGVDLADLDEAPGVTIAVAGGEAKRSAIAGALRHGHIDILVTTEEDALALLESEAAQAPSTTRGGEHA